MCEEYNQVFKFTRLSLRFVNKTLLANHKQAALLSATDSSGKLCILCKINQMSTHFSL